MAQVKIRQLPDWVLRVHKQQAQRAGESLEQHLRTLLTESALARKRAFLEVARSCREKLGQETGGKLSERASDVIREMRDERG